MYKTAFCFHLHIEFVFAQNLLEPLHEDPLALHGVEQPAVWKHITEGSEVVTLLTTGASFFLTSDSTSRWKHILNTGVLSHSHKSRHVLFFNIP